VSDTQLQSLSGGHRAPLETSTMIRFTQRLLSVGLTLAGISLPAASQTLPKLHDASLRSQGVKDSGGFFRFQYRLTVAQSESLVAEEWALDIRTDPTREKVANDGLPAPYLFVRAGAEAATSSVAVTDLVLDGQPMLESVVATAGEGGLKILRVEASGLDGFTLAGNVTMSWTGDQPSGSELSVQLRAADVHSGPD